MKTPKRFIVVDDDPVNNLLCKFCIGRVFKEADIKLFLEAENALEVIKGEYTHPDPDRYTILFLDINMPSMSGWDFLEAFKDLGEDIQRQFGIYMLSSSVDERDKERAQANPFIAGFLSKPLKAEMVTKLFLK